MFAEQRPIGEVGIAVVRECEQRNVSRPAETLVALRAVGRDLQKIRPRAIHDRLLQTVGFREQGFLLIRVRNYCETPPTLIDGLPRTSKDDTTYHGFGVLSIRHTAEKYGGTMSIRTDQNRFRLDILIPMEG